MDDVRRGFSWLWHKLLRPNAVDEPGELGHYGHEVLAANSDKPLAKPQLQIAAE